MSLRVALLACAVLIGAPACKREQTATATPTAGLVAKGAPMAASAPTDPVAAAAARVPPHAGACAQVRSMNDPAAAEAVAESIRKAKGLPVELQSAELPGRGTWYRVCVGNEDSEARLTARATRWTSPGGELEAFLDPPEANLPRFHVLQRSVADQRRPTAPQAMALLRFALTPGAPAIFVGGPEQAALVLASTADTTTGTTDVVATNAQGKRLLLADGDAPGCARCALARKESVVRARRAVAAGDLAPAPGDELLVEEETEKGVRMLAVVAVDGGTLKRVAGVVLDAARAGFVQTGTASVVEADTDAQKEIAVQTTELLLHGDAGCSVSSHAALYDLGAGGQGLTRLDPLALPPDPVDAVLNVITALDGAGDHETASKVCAAQMSREPRGPTSQLCIQRVRTLLDGGATVAAVNAVGMMAEGAAALRPVLATAFHQAASRLDTDPKLDATERSCEKDPLVAHVTGQAPDVVMAAALRKAGERVDLADVADAVFVTGVRDFGPDSPAGAVVVRWLERAKQSLPARYAAVEALLLPQAPDAPAAPDADGPANADAGAGFGGHP